MTTAIAKIQVRRDITLNLNPIIPSIGEFAYGIGTNSNPNQLKIGDGIHNWGVLPTFITNGSSSTIDVHDTTTGFTARAVETGVSVDNATTGLSLTNISDTAIKIGDGSNIIYTGINIVGQSDSDYPNNGDTGIKINSLQTGINIDNQNSSTQATGLELTNLTSGINVTGLLGNAASTGVNIDQTDTAINVTNSTNGVVIDGNGGSNGVSITNMTTGMTITNATNGLKIGDGTNTITTGIDIVGSGNAGTGINISGTGNALEIYGADGYGQGINIHDSEYAMKIFNCQSGIDIDAQTALNGNVYSVAGTQVVGAQQPVVVAAVTSTDVVTAFNILLSSLMSHGLVASPLTIGMNTSYATTGISYPSYGPVTVNSNRLVIRLQKDPNDPWYYGNITRIVFTNLDENFTGSTVSIGYDLLTSGVVGTTSTLTVSGLAGQLSAENKWLVLDGIPNGDIVFTMYAD